MAQHRSTVVRKGVAPLWAPALAGALALALLVSTAAPATADTTPADIDHAAKYSACVGAAADSAGLRDVEGTNFESAVNCLAHYGITQGTPDGLYEPDEPVTRAQMALFLTRAASPAGISLDGGAPQGFTDIDGLSTTVQTAINQLAELGITKGKSAHRFDPYGTVTRAQMALFLDRFLSKAVLGPGAAGATGYQPPTFKMSDITADREVFTDIGQLSAESRQAIGRLYELGVTKGVTATTFEGAANVTRGQMALFISRMLAHTNARPAGVTIQADRARTFGQLIRFVVSVRDSDRRPATSNRVDVFRVPSDDRDASDPPDAPDEAFGADGRCRLEGSSGTVVSVGGDETSCVIAPGDGVVDLLGNVVDTYSTHGSGTVWAWQGSFGSTFNRNEVSADTVTVTVGTPAVTSTITHSLAEEATALEFGTAATFTIQLLDISGQPVAEPDRRVRVRIARSHNTSVESPVSRIHRTDATGRVTLEYTVDDPYPRSTGDTVELTVSTVAGYGLTASGDRRTVKWSDEPPVAESLVVSFEPGFFKVASDHKDGASNVVRATLRDQYGHPISARLVTFSSDDSFGIGRFGARFSDVNPVKRTDSRGVAELRYLRDDASSSKETVTVTAEGFDGAVSAAFFWIHVCYDEACDVDSAPLSLLDTDTNLIIYYDVAVDNYRTASYRLGDHISFNGASKTIDDFESAYHEHRSNNPHPDYIVSVTGYSDDGIRPSGIAVTASP